MFTKCILAAAVLVAGGVSLAAVELVPFRIEETRVTQMVKDEIGHEESSLRVTFSLKGAEVADAAKYGELKLEEAVDDKGTKLIPGRDPFEDAAKFKEFSNEFFRKMDRENKRAVSAPQVEIRLNSAVRGATKIAKLKGTLSVMSQGTIKKVEVTGLKPGDTKKLEIPAKAGVSATINIKKDKEVSEITVELTGNESAIESIEVLDAAGETVSNGTGTSTMDGKTTQSISLTKPLDAKMKVVANVAMDRKVTKVPFELKDIVLP